MCCALNMFQRHYHVMNWAYIEKRTAGLPCVKGIVVILCSSWEVCRCCNSCNLSCVFLSSYFSCKEESFTNFEEEGQESDLRDTTSSLLPVG